jgi:chromosome segregation ATPase
MGSLTRTNLERLLRSCERLSGDMHGRADRQRFESYLVVLQRQWRELKAQSQCSEDALAEFRRKIQRLAELLDEGKLLSGAGSSLALTQAHCNAHLSRSQANAELVNRLREKERMQQALRSQLSLEVGPSDAPVSEAEARAVQTGRAAATGARATGGMEAEALRATLQTERAAQEHLMSDLLRSVGELRDRSVQARHAVREDNNTLDMTSKEIDKNQSQLGTISARLRAQIMAARSSSCLVFFMLLFVAVVFFLTLLLMKVKSKNGR